MSDKHLSLRPHHIRGEDRLWWYEEPDGICIVVPKPPPDEEWDSIQATIKWDSLRAALSRKDKP